MEAPLTPPLPPVGGEEYKVRGESKKVRGHDRDGATAPRSGEREGREPQAVADELRRDGTPGYGVGRRGAAPTQSAEAPI